MLMMALYHIVGLVPALQLVRVAVARAVITSAAGKGFRGDE